jgi:hypothetical protein
MPRRSFVDVPLHVHHHGVETHQRRASHARRSSSARGKNVCLRDWGPTVAAPSALTRPLQYSPVQIHIRLSEGTRREMGSGGKRKSNINARTASPLRRIEIRIPIEPFLRLE